MVKQPPDWLVSTVATIKAPDLELEEIEHGLLPMRVEVMGKREPTWRAGKSSRRGLFVRLSGASISGPHTPERAVSHGLLGAWCRLGDAGQPEALCLTGHRPIRAPDLAADGAVEAVAPLLTILRRRAEQRDRDRMARARAKVRRKARQLG